VLEEAPDRLLIEPTGLARPQDLIDTLRRCPERESFELGPVVVLVDPTQLARAEAGVDDVTRGLLREQVQGADVLVANRVDLSSEEDLAAFERVVAGLWPAPLAVHRTRHGALPDDALEWPAGEGARAERRVGEEHPHDHASTEGHRARSWQWPPDAVFSGRRLRDALQELAKGPAPVARFKGIFRTEEGTSRLEIAGGVLHDRLTSYRRDSRADAIVRGDDAALDAIGQRLEQARLRADELAVDPNRVEWVLPDGRVFGVDRAALRALPGGIPDVATSFPKRRGAAARGEAVFEELGLPTTGSAVVVAGDGVASAPVDVAVLRRGVLLPSQADAPLPGDQGGPFRLLIPEDASPEPVSCANVKGVAKVVLRD
jgi:G3E family GTPase